MKKKIQEKKRLGKALLMRTVAVVLVGPALIIILIPVFSNRSPTEPIVGRPQSHSKHTSRGSSFLNIKLLSDNLTWVPYFFNK